MLELIIYLVIGGALIALFAFLFIREGQREEQSRPQYAWEKAVEDYGDPTLLSLYRRAKTDEERLEIASFVNPELNSQSSEIKEEEELLEEAAEKKKSRRKRFGKKKNQEPEELPTEEPTDSIPEQEDTYLEHTTSYDRDDLTRLWGAATSVETNNDKAEVDTTTDTTTSEEEDNFSIKEILSAPAYNFWQEPAVEEQTEPTEEQPEPAEEQSPAIDNIIEPTSDDAETTNIDEEPAAETTEEIPSDQPSSFFAAEEITISDAAYAPAVANETADRVEEETPLSEAAEEAISPEIPETIAVEAEQDIVSEEAVTNEPEAITTDTDTAIAAEEAATEPVFIPKHLEEELCPVCGNPLEPDCAFCIICGTKVKELAEEPPVAATAEATIVEEEQPKAKRRFFGRKKAKAEEELAAAAAVAATTTAAQPDIFAEDPRANMSAPAAAPTCPVCGAELEPGFAYCIICGEAVGDAAPAAPEPEQQTPVAEPQSTAAQNEDFWSQPTNNNNQNAAPTTTANFQAAAPAANSTQTINPPAPDPDVVAAYRASTASAYAAAAAKGMVSDKDFVPPIKPAAHQEPAPVATQPAPKPAAPAASASTSGQPAVDYSAMTLQDILENVKALERRIMAEAEAANRNSMEADKKADQQ